MIQPSKPEEIEFPKDVRHVAIAGDWHGNLHYAKRMIEELPDHVEAMLHTGDFGYMFEDDFLNSVNKAARRKGIVVMFVDGNHENHSWLNAQPVDADGVRRLRPRVWHLPRAFRWEWLGIRFIALGGAYSIDRKRRSLGISYWEEETLTEGELLMAYFGGDADVMISHDAPDGHFIPGLMPAHFLSDEVLAKAQQHREAVGQVARQISIKYVWHGHYHSSYRTDNGDMIVTGLDCDGSRPEFNVDIVDLEELEV